MIRVKMGYHGVLSRVKLKSSLKEFTEKESSKYLVKVNMCGG